MPICRVQTKRNPYASLSQVKSLLISRKRLQSRDYANTETKWWRGLPTLCRTKLTKISPLFTYLKETSLLDSRKRKKDKINPTK